MLPINTLIVTDPETTVEAIMQPPVVKLLQHEKADVAASARSSATTSFPRPSSTPTTGWSAG